MLSKEKLLEKLNALKVSKDELIANVNATAGAIQMCEILLKELEVEEQKVGD